MCKMCNCVILIDKFVSALYTSQILRKGYLSGNRTADTKCPAEIMFTLRLVESGSTHGYTLPRSVSL